MKFVIFGNSGSGKSTLARRLAERFGLDHLDLDELAWDPGPKRRPLERSAEQIERWMADRGDWVVEGCYSDLVELVMEDSDAMIFLNPGTETCLRNCASRPWEPHKYESPEAQDANLPMLLDWVRGYETRSDEFCLNSHQALFRLYKGQKVEVTELEHLEEMVSRLVEEMPG